LTNKVMYFPDRGWIRTLCTLYVYATDSTQCRLRNNQCGITQASNRNEIE